MQPIHASRFDGHRQRRSAPTLRWAGVFAVLLASADRSRSEVSARLPGDPITVLERLGGRTVQSGDVRVNGRPGRLTVVGHEVSAAGLRASLARTLDRQDLIPSGGGSLLFEWPSSSGRPIQVLLLPGESSERSLAMVLDVPTSLPDESAAWPWRDLAPPEGFAPRLVVEASDSGTSMATGSVGRAPEGVRREAAERLAASGWAPATPAAGVVGTALFARGQEIVLLTVLSSDAPEAACRLLYLRRRPR